MYYRDESRRSLRCEFDEPQRAITPGQAVVFMMEILLLGGTILYGKTNKILGPRMFYLINLISLILSFQPFYFFL